MRSLIQKHAGTLFTVLIVSFALVDAALGTEVMVPLEIRVPRPPFVNGPIPMEIENLEPRFTSRPPFMVPVGTTNLAAGKLVTASNTNLAAMALARITDGEKTDSDDLCVNVGRRQQWVQIDLGTNAEIFAVLVWRDHSGILVYFDVVVQISTDPRFETNVTTIFNNDADNSLGLGAGKDCHYMESYQGRLMDAKGVKGRYVRSYSSGSHTSRSNYYLEVEVFGRPISQSESAEFKGYMKQTRHIENPDNPTIDKIEALKLRLKESSGPKPQKTGPKDLASAAEYLSENVNMACPPGAALEHGGWFYFSGGTTSETETNFISGLAIKRGDTAIFYWSKEVTGKAAPADKANGK